MHLVYVIRNLVNDKMYVGQTRKPGARWSAHRSEARCNSPHPLHKAIRKYGEENFAFETVLQVDTREQADYQEKIWIVLLGAHRSKGGYVVSHDGQGNAGILPADLSRRGRAISKAFSEREGPHHSRRTDIDTAEVVRLYHDEGKLIKEIAVLLKCSADLVSDRLKEAGRSAGQGGRPKGYVYPSNSKKQIDEDRLFSMYSEGYSTTRISRALKCSTKMVRDRLIEAGITPRTLHESLEARKSLPPVTWTRSEESNRKLSASITKAWREGRHVGNTLAKRAA